MLTERFQRALGKAFGDGVRRRGPGHPAQPVRRLPGQRGARAGQEAGREAEGRRPADRRASRPRRRRRSAGDQRAGVRQRPAGRRLDRRPGRPPRRPARRTHPGATDDPGRLLGAQRGQGDARRPPAHHRRRRRARPHAGAPRPPRDPAEPRRRLGDAVRDAHRAPAGRRRGLPRGAAARHRPQRLLRRGERRVRGRRGVRDQGPGQGGPPPGRRRRHPAPLGRAGRPVQAVLQPRLLDAGRHAHRRRTWPASRRTTTSSPRSATSSRPRASRRSATARCASSSTATPAARASRSR